jgi:hypothetical protein
VKVHASHVIKLRAAAVVLALLARKTAPVSVCRSRPSCSTSPPLRCSHLVSANVQAPPVMSGAEAVPASEVDAPPGAVAIRSASANVNAGVLGASPSLQCRPKQLGLIKARGVCM